MNFARRKVLLLKKEVTYGTDAVPTAATDALQVSNCTIKPVDADLVDRQLVQSYLGLSQQIPVATRMSVQFEVEMVGSGTAGTAPGWGAAMKACGFAETVSAGVSVAYSPVSLSFDSATIYYHQDGLKHVILGARGSVSMKMTPRGLPMFMFNFLGLYGGVTDLAVPAATLTAFKIPVAVSNANTSAFTLQGFAGKMYDLSIDLANTLTYRNLVGGEDVQITDRAPVGSIEIETPTVAGKDFWTAAKAGTLGALSITHGIVAGYKVKLDTPDLQLTNPEYADRDGVLSMKAGMRLVPSAAGNDELTVTAL